MITANDQGGTVPTVSAGNSRSTRTLGLIGFLFMAQFIVFLSVVDQAPYLPGNWSTDWQPNETFMLGYMILMIGTIGLLVALPRNLGSKQPATLGGFLRSFGIGGFLTWGVTSVIVFGLPGYFPVPGMPDTGSRFAAITFYLIFVAVTEELLFRVVLPLYTVYKGKSYWWLASVVGFVVFHFPAYSVQVATMGLPWYFVFIKTITVGALGALLYYLYRKYGYGMAVGVHTGFDLAATGWIGTLQIISRYTFAFF